MTTPFTTRQRDVNAMLERYATRMQGELMRATQTCVNCVHFDLKAEVCRANNSQRPPAHIIAFGCDWFIEDIPY